MSAFASTGQLLQYLGQIGAKVDAETGDEVDSAEIIKEYEVGKGDYIELDPEELERELPSFSACTPTST